MIKESLVSLQHAILSVKGGLFIKNLEEGSVYLLVYVNDILIAAKTTDNVNTVKVTLVTTFDARDFGDASYFLGWEIKRDRARRIMKVSQAKMTSSLISK